jgi:chaperonin cofactor prefoldin
MEQDLEWLDDNTNVFKMMGTLLMKQDLAMANANVIN